LHPKSQMHKVERKRGGDAVVARRSPAPVIGGPAPNIPTELLRTLVAVVDLRSFTQAARSLRITQPAVSAQIKRLQTLLGCDLLDKSAPGVQLTSRGQLIVNYARRLLAINDQILGLSQPEAEEVIRLGMHGDFIGPLVSGMLADFHRRSPATHIQLRTGSLESMMDDLDKGNLDIVLGLSPGAPPASARHCWSERLVWVGSPKVELKAGEPIPLVSYSPACAFHRSAVKALDAAKLPHETVFTGPSLAVLAAAVQNGFGVMALPRRSAERTEWSIWEDGRLPKLEEIYLGVYIREGADRERLEQLVDDIAKALRPAGEAKRPAGKSGVIA
jgi:DNA-binding transcriptional LysR family regulator